MSRRVTLLPALLFIAALGGIVEAAEPRFQHVALLAARDRVSLVFELTGEPNDVATRRVSAAVLELDAGPVTMPARPASFMAPPGTRFVMGVSIQPGTGAAGGRLKARITLLERARSAVRVVGRRVYVDFSADELPVKAEGLAAPRQEARATAVPPRAQVAAVAEAPTPPPAPSNNQAYRATVQTAIERFEQLTPFMLSAAASPSEPVLKAIGSTLAGIQGLLLSVDVPADARQGHDVLASAVATAVTAVSPTFTGDRAAQARQALSLLAQAKSTN